MQNLKTKKLPKVPYIKYRALKYVSLGFIVIGICVILFAFTPSINQPQCEITYTPGCIIGANIGMGLIVLAGAVIALLGVVGLVMLAIFKLIDKRSKNPRKLKWGVIIFVLLGLVLLWNIPVYFESSELSEPLDNSYILEE
jgi:hypothetical protein